MYNGSRHRNNMSATRSIMINTGNVIRPLLSNRCSLIIMWIAWAVTKQP